MADSESQKGFIVKNIKSRNVPIHYVQDGYDRCSLRRQRKHLLHESITSGSAKLLFVYDGNAACLRNDTGFQIGLIDSGVLSAPILATLQTVFLGERRGEPVFAVITNEHPFELPGLQQHTLLFMDLAKLNGALSHRDASMMSYAQAMDHWHRSHLYCGTCGCVTESGESGHTRQCTNRQCGKIQYPRTDPAVIVLVRSDSACLLGRKRGWERNRYSTIAGFVEPGESPEQAVYREVYEETGTIVRKARYFASQPWPFPGSLMLGFTATADTGLVSLKDHELEDAAWYTHKQIRKRVPSGELRLPPRISIAYRLIEQWFNQGSSKSLDELMPE